MRNMPFCMPVLLLLFALSGVGVSIHPSSAAAAPTVISTISVGRYPYGVGVNSSTNRIYVANYSSNTVSVIDGATNTVISTISVGSKPSDVGVNSSTNRIYVSHYFSNIVSVIDGATNTVTSTISVGSYPWGVGVNSWTNRIYVGTSNTVTATISAVSGTTYVRVNSSTNRIYVTYEGSNVVSVIDGATNMVLSTISVGSRPEDVGVNSSTNRVYVANSFSNTVSVIEDSPSSPPTVATGSATNVTSSSATLNGTVNANGTSTTAWFNYGITSGSYTGTSTTQSVSGSSDITVSIGISGLSSSTTYYYRIAASSSAGTSYGSESSFTTSASTSDLNNGLVAYYPLNGNANDESGNRNNGTVYDATLTTDRNGNANSAYGFSGNAYISVPDSNSLKPSNLTIAVWIKPNSFSSTADIISKYYADGYYLRLLSSKIDFAAAGTSNATDTYVSVGTWNHVVATYDGTYQKIYINGSLKHTTSGMGSYIRNVSYPLAIGAFTDGSLGFNGSIDEVRLYNRALSETEIYSLYNDTTTTPTPTPTPTDTAAPTGSVSINSGALYTNSTIATLSLSATDSVGVMGYYLSDSSTIPSASASGWTSVTSTTSYSATVSYSLSSGEGSKTIYAWYRDAAGNVSSTASATITLDTTVPTVTISSPTSNSTYTATSNTISLGGSASDSVSGISSVAWSNNKGGNGSANGTASWTISGISLSSGDNTITVTAKDNAGNTGTDAISVTYNGGTVASPTPTPKPSPTPTPKTSPSPTKTPVITPVVTVHPTPTPSPTPIRGNGVVLGFVYDLDSEPLLEVDVTIAGNNFSESTETDSNGYYEFDKLATGDYTLTYERDGYETQTVDIKRMYLLLMMLPWKK